MPFTQVPIAFEFDQLLGQIRWKGIVIAPSSAGGGPTLLSAVGAYTVPIGTVAGQVLKLAGPVFSATWADSGALGSMPGLGMVYAMVGPTNATVAYAGEVTGLGGLTPGAEYFLGTAGAVTTVAPAVGFVQRIGTAVSAGTFIFNPDSFFVQL